MYGRAFADLDGHIFEPMWMDVTEMLSASGRPQPALA